MSPRADTVLAMTSHPFELLHAIAGPEATFRAGQQGLPIVFANISGLGCDPLGPTSAIALNMIDAIVADECDSN